MKSFCNNLSGDIHHNLLQIIIMSYIETKHNAIMDIEVGQDLDDLCEIYQVAKTTLRDWYDTKQSITDEYYKYVGEQETSVSSKPTDLTKRIKKPRRCSYSAQTKCSIIHEVEQGATQCSVAKKHNIPYTTVNKWMLSADTHKQMYAKMMRNQSIDVPDHSNESSTTSNPSSPPPLLPSTSPPAISPSSTTQDNYTIDMWMERSDSISSDAADKEMMILDYSDDVIGAMNQPEERFSDNSLSIVDILSMCAQIRFFMEARACSDQELLALKTVENFVSGSLN